MKSIVLALTSCCLFMTTADGAPKGKAADKWVEQKGSEPLEERQADGDSFGMTVEGAKNRLKRTYRLYGVDCPESNADDPLLKIRIQEQAEWFGCKPEDIPKMGKDAAAFTAKLLKNGKPRVLTRGKMGQKVQKAAGRPQRYYALVEVTAPDGKRRWLHELLLEAGLARAYGVPAAWPPEQEDRRGQKEAEKKFMNHLEHLEKAAKREKAGVWKNFRHGKDACYDRRVDEMRMKTGFARVIGIDAHRAPLQVGSWAIPSMTGTP